MEWNQLSVMSVVVASSTAKGDTAEAMQNNVNPNNNNDGRMSDEEFLRRLRDARARGEGRQADRHAANPPRPHNIGNNTNVVSFEPDEIDEPTKNKRYEVEHK
jgi:hypothetical protein